MLVECLFQFAIFTHLGNKNNFIIWIIVNLVGWNIAVHNVKDLGKKFKKNYFSRAGGADYSFVFRAGGADYSFVFRAGGADYYFVFRAGAD